MQIRSIQALIPEAMDLETKPRLTEQPAWLRESQRDDIR
jgi:hypothetical protein